MSDTSQPYDPTLLAAAVAQIEQLRADCVRFKAEAEAARDAANAARDSANQAKSKAEAESGQVAQIITGITSARATAEQEKDKVVAASAAALASNTTIEEQKSNVATAAAAIDAEHTRAKQASSAAVVASESAERAKGAAETAKLETDAQRGIAAEAAQAAATAKSAVDVAQTAVAKSAAEIEAAKGGAANAQSTAEAASAAAVLARQNSEGELEKAKKARTDSEATQKSSAKLANDIAQLKENATKHHAQAKLAEEQAKQSSATAEQNAKNAAEALNLSTSVTLAGAFNKKAEKNTWREWIWALTLLVSLVGILLIGIWRYEGLSAAILKTTDTRTLLAEILLAFFGVSAPVWLAWMSTRMLGRTFALVEDYSYKAAMAQAYVGFREEAKDLDPILQERLFAAAITQLDSNPVRLLNAEHPGSPLQDLLQQKFMQDALRNSSFKAEMKRWMGNFFRARVVEIPVLENVPPASPTA